MAEISKINVNETEYNIRSYVPFASTVPQKIGTFQGCDVCQIIVELKHDENQNRYEQKTITIYPHYDILNISGVYNKIVSNAPGTQATYYPIPDEKKLEVKIEQTYQVGSAESHHTDITIKCDFWDEATAKRDTNYVYVTLTLIKRTR